MQEKEYQHYMTPYDLHRATNTLRGIVAGINTDAKVSQDEINELTHWCQLHSNFRDRHPFSEIIPIIETACEDGVVTEDEAADILWVCSSFANFAEKGKYYDSIASSIQFLSGLIHGIMADGELSDREIKALRSWIHANEFLSGCYPYDEINTLLIRIMEDNKIDDDERNTILAFLSNLVEFKNSFNLNEKDFAELRETYSVPGICASNPDVQFEGRTFCLTGAFYRGTKKEISEVILRLGGSVMDRVSKKIDYLIVGNAGNPCWAFTCYGRKIEDAVKLRKEGANVVIVNETDFFTSVDRMGESL